MRVSLRASRVVRLFVLLVPLAILCSAPASAAAPAVRITMPTNGATIAGPDVTIVTEYTDVALIDGRVATKREDLHTHYLLDVDVTPYLDGVRDMPLGDPTLVHSAATSYTFTGVAPGPHRAVVILSYSDHKVSQPVAMAEVNFTVTAMPTTPRAGGGGTARPPAAPLLISLLGTLLLGSGLTIVRRRMRHQ